MYCRMTFILIALATACTSTPGPTPSTQPYPVATRLTADLTGQLVVADNCLRVNAAPGAVSHLLVWPPEYTGQVRVENDTVQVIDRGQTVVWRIGDIVHLGGHAVSSAEDLDEQLRQALPASCPGPYWVVGDVAGLVGATQEPPASPAVSSAQDALLEDAQAYATHYGLDIQEAMRRLKLQELAGVLDAELAVREQETFAGLWIQHAPQFRIIAQFTRNGEETIRPYVENGLLADIIEIRTAKVSLAELQAAQATAMRAIGDLGISMNSGINLPENRVELYVAEPAQLEAALRKANVQLPGYVVVLAAVE